MQPESEKTRLTQQWLAKARRDLLAAERLLAGSSPLNDVALFHCQQAAEKALKAFLTWHDRPFRRSHDLRYLVEECSNADIGFKQLLEAAALLNPYATVFRYPGDIPEPPADAIDGAVQAARHLVHFVEARLPVDTRS